MMELVQLLQTNAVAFYGVVAFVGLFVGSFLNVVIHRLPIMMENAWREGLLELEAELAVAVGETPDISAATSAQVRTTNSDPSAEQVHEGNGLGENQRTGFSWKRSRGNVSHGNQRTLATRKRSRGNAY